MVRFAAAECQPLWKAVRALWTERGPSAPAADGSGRRTPAVRVCCAGFGCTASGANRVKTDRAVSNVLRAGRSHGPGLCPVDGSEYRSQRRAGAP